MAQHSNSSASTLPVDRIRAYARQRGVSTVGMTKNATAARKVAAKLTARQRRRLAKRGLAA